MRITSKRVLSLFLALLMVFSLFPVSAFAADSGSDTYYVQAGIDANKPDEQLYMSIDAALNAAASNDASDFSIVLKSDIQATETIEFTGGKNIFINSEGGPWRIAYAGQHEIGNATGFIEVGGGAKVTFDSVTLDKGSSSYSSRVLHVSNGGEVVLDNATVTNGNMLNPNQNRGGAGIYVEAGGAVTLGNCTCVTGNNSHGGAGGIYVAENGSLTVNDATIFENTADGNGAGIYVATNGAMTLTDGAVIEANTSSNGGLGGGIYVEADANASVSGNVSVTGNNAATGNDVFLAEGATLDVAGSTTEAKIGIAAEDEVSYRLVSNQVNGYEIAPTRAGDEKGFTLESGSYDIRYMVYNDVPGLYLFDKTLSISIQDVDTLTAITGKDINGESVDFLQAAVPGTTNENGVLTVPDVVAKNAEDGFEFTFTCDTDKFRIPTEDIVEATSNGQPVAFTYTPDFENGTATVIFSKDVLSGLTVPIELTISAEAYHTLTVSMNGPLYELQSSITGLRESPIAVSSTVKQGEALEGSSIKYKITRGGAPLSDVSVQLFQDGADETAVYTQVTNADGEVEFTGLTSGVAYYPVLVYSKDYRVIDRDVISFKLSVLDGQELDDTCTNTTGEVTYDASMKTAEVKNVGEDGTVTFSLKQSKDTIVFHANPGDATTTPELSYGGLTNSSTVSKTLEASAVKYGDLASASLTGYDFLGWFTQAEGGEQITADSSYDTAASAKELYAHWQARTDTRFKVQHLVEFVEAGENCNGDTTKLKDIDGKTYYLYDETTHAGTSDATQAIDSLALESMSCAEHTWWTLDGMNVVPDTDCKVLADGSSVFTIRYDRKSFEVSFKTPLEAGTSVNNDPIDPITVKFGAQVGAMPNPKLDGYRLAGWWLDEQQVNSNTPYQWTEDIELTAKWNAASNACYAIKVVTQDIAQYSDSGVYYTPGTYTIYNTVFKDNDGYELSGAADSTVEFKVSDLKALNIAGFEYVGYGDFERNGVGMTKDTENASVYVKPTELHTSIDGKYNAAFDAEGGLVYLYFNRKTIPCTVVDGQGTEHDEGELIYGGTFNGHLIDPPVKDGYDFVKFVDADGNGVDKDTKTDKYVVDNESIVITPVWEPRTYNLVYVPGPNATFQTAPGTVGKPIEGGGVAGGYIDPNDVTYDQKMGPMPSASKSGYDFLGWFTEAEGGEQITSDTMVNVSTVVISNAPDCDYEKTLPLYAHFQPHTYTLKFNPGESKTGVKGTVSPATKEITFGEIIGTLPTPVLEGYVFGGWMLKNADSTIATISANDAWTRPYTNGATIELYASWTPKSYTYNFNLNDNTGSTRANLVGTDIDYVDIIFDSPYGDQFEVVAQRSGYKFLGWSLNASGPVLGADDLNQTTKNATLYAIWEPLEYTVRLEMNGGTIANLPGAVYDADTDTWTMKVKFDTVYGELPIPSKADCTYRGYLATAPGWPADAGYGITVNGEILTSLPQYIDHVDAGGITLSAVLEPWFTFSPAPGTFADGSSDPVKILQSDIDKLPEAVREHYTFLGWTDADGNIVTAEDVKTSKEPLTLTPSFSANIIFNPNGGTFAESGSKESLEMDHTLVKDFPAVTKDGWTFLEWRFNGEAVSLDELLNAEEPMEVIAHFDGWYFKDIDNDGTDEKIHIGDDETPYTPDDWYEYDVDGKEPPEVIHVGDDGLPGTEDDWYNYDVNGDGKDEVIHVGPDGIPGTKDDWYDYKIDGKDETIHVGDDGIPGTEDDWYNHDVDLDGKDEIIHVGEDGIPGTEDDWYNYDVDDDGEDEKVFVGPDGVPGTEDDWYEDDDGNKVVLGILLRFDANGGTVNGKSIYKAWLKKLSSIPVAVRASVTSGNKTTNYTFEGWYTASGEKLSDSAIKALKRNTALFAKWSEKTVDNTPSGGGGGGFTGGGGSTSKKYTVTFLSDFGGVLCPSQTVASGSVAKKPADPTMKGYRFLGWYETTAQNAKLFNFSTKITKDITLYGRWEKTVSENIANTFRLDHVAYIHGYEDGTVRPEANITRAEAAMIFYRLLRDDVRAQYETNHSKFTDVSADAWYNTAVCTLANMGILRGRTMTTFAPNATITRAEFAAIAARFDKCDSTEMPFTDVPTSHWAYGEIACAYVNGWVGGRGDNKFCPDEPIKRDEVMTLINRVFLRNRLVGETQFRYLRETGEDANIITWPDNMDSYTWYYLDVQEATNSHDCSIESNIEFWTKLLNN